MKMAKASEADIDMAMELANVLEDIERGTFPSKFNDPDSEEIEWLHTGNCEQYDRLINSLRRLLNQGSIHRVVFGMAVVCDPRNKLIDPDATVLEHHPICQKLELERDDLLEALKACQLELACCNQQLNGQGYSTGKTVNDALDAARAAIAKATGTF